MISDMKKTIWATFVGIPNAGKSTLLNSVVGSKISIVTHKAQTTRTTLKGIITEGDVQIVIMDTPGIFEARRNNVERLMVDCALNSLQDVDEVFFIVDVRKPKTQDNMHVLDILKTRNIKCNLVLNKIDLIKKEQLLEIARELNDSLDFKKTFMISATKKLGIAEMLKFLQEQAKTPGWFFAEDDITSAPLRFIVSEIVREKLFLYTHDELPYNLDVEVELWEEKNDVAVISVLIAVKNKSHKSIVIGSRGELIKKVGIKAREDIEQLLGKKVYLNTHVKVHDWAKAIVSKGFKQF